MKNGKILYPAAGIAILLLGALDFLACALMAQSSVVTATDKSTVIFLLTANIKMIAALVVGIGLIRKKEVARYAAIALCIVAFSFLLVWLDANGTALLGEFAWAFIFYTALILPAMLVIPAALAVPSVRGFRARGRQVTMPAPQMPVNERKNIAS